MYYTAASFYFLIFCLIYFSNSITHSYRTNLNRVSIKHDILKKENTIKKVIVVSEILNYVGYTKSTLTMYVLHKLHGQLSHCHDLTSL